MVTVRGARWRLQYTPCLPRITRTISQVRRLLWMLLLVPATLVAGCSCADESEDRPARQAQDTREAAALTTQEYRSRGNAICRRAARRAQAVRQPDAPFGLDDYLERTFDVFSDYNRALARLQPPASLREAHDESVRLGRRRSIVLDGTLRRVRASSRPQRTGNGEARKFARSRLLRRSVKVTRTLGLTDCLAPGLPTGAAG